MFSERLKQLIVASGKSQKTVAAELLLSHQRFSNYANGNREPDYASVSKKTDYLIVGNDGNPCWAFSCYGRKVEEAIALRKAGTTVTIVNERDFWAAVTAAKGAA